MSVQSTLGRRDMELRGGEKRSIEGGRDGGAMARKSEVRMVVVEGSEGVILPKGARRAAKLVARGEKVGDVAKVVGVELRVLRGWMKEKWWREELRRNFLTKPDVVDRVDGMVERAIRVKEGILKSGSVDIELRNKVASEILGMRGLDRLYEEKVEEFELSSGMVDGVRGDLKMAGKRVVKRVELESV